MPAPGVHTAPMPAFPRIRIVQKLRIPQDVVEAGHGTHLVVEKTVVMMRGHKGRDSCRPVGLPDPRDLLDEDVIGLVPAYAHVLVLAPEFGMPSAVRIEVLAFHGVLDTVLRVDAHALGYVVRVDGGLPRIGELLALGLDSPVATVLFGQAQGAHAGDDPVFDGDLHHTSDATVYEFLLCHEVRYLL
jgi:hypothetical protein